MNTISRRRCVKYGTYWEIFFTGTEGFARAKFSGQTRRPNASTVLSKNVNKNEFGAIYKKNRYVRKARTGKIKAKLGDVFRRVCGDISRRLPFRFEGPVPGKTAAIGCPFPKRSIAFPVYF